MTEIDKPMKNKLNLKYFTVFKLGLKLFLSQFCENFLQKIIYCKYSDFIL